MGSRFPAAVLATAFATFVAFMGIGVVDPILPLIGKSMGASPAQVEWLFTSYIAIMALAMLGSGVLATRLGGKRTLLLGLGLVVVFATTAGLSPSIGFLAVVRGGWGLGNALFTSTALAIIVGLSKASVGEAITLYEAALGLGIASGPLLGGFLGSHSWRYPFFGTAALMAVAFIFTAALIREPDRHEAPRTLSDMRRALAHPAVKTNALIGLAYSFAFFTILAYSPLTLTHLDPTALGFTYFFWGISLAFSSVVVVNWLLRYLSETTLLAANLAVLALILTAAGMASQSGLLAVIVLSGFFCGIANALFTTLAIRVSPFSRSISSGAYNFLRWSGAAIAPVLSGRLGQSFFKTLPFFVAAAVLAIGVIGLLARRGVLEAALRAQEEQASSPTG